ncbi:MAG: 50S ribosomal protein L20 [Nitrospirota bacterium]|nr:50S ribosomal protein L20 [Nitrospirota bacterium]
MARVKGGIKTRKRHKKYIKQAKGYVGGRGALYRTARETVDRAGVYAYRDRRCRKREYRALWIVRINAAANALGLSYSRFMGALRKQGVELDRRALADLAANQPEAFSRLVEQVKAAA